MYLGIVAWGACRKELLLCTSSALWFLKSLSLRSLVRELSELPFLKSSSLYLLLSPAHSLRCRGGFSLASCGRRLPEGASARHATLRVPALGASPPRPFLLSGNTKASQTARTIPLWNSSTNTGPTNRFLSPLPGQVVALNASHCALRCLLFWRELFRLSAGTSCKLFWLVDAVNGDLLFAGKASARRMHPPGWAAWGRVYRGLPQVHSRQVSTGGSQRVASTVQDLCRSLRRRPRLFPSLVSWTTSWMEPPGAHILHQQYRT